MFANAFSGFGANGLSVVNAVDEGAASEDVQSADEAQNEDGQSQDVAADADAVDFDAADTTVDSSVDEQFVSDDDNQEESDND